MIIYFVMLIKWYSGELTTPNDRNSYQFIKQIILKTKCGRREQWFVDYIVSDKRNFRDGVINTYYFTNAANKTNKNNNNGG